MDTPGLTFAPLGFPSEGNGRSTDPAQGGPTIQDAIRVLSLRVPRVLGARGPVADPLFGRPGQGQGAAPFQRNGTPGQPNPGMDEILRRLFGAFQHGAPGGQEVAPQAPQGPPLPRLSFPVQPTPQGPIARAPQAPEPTPVQPWDESQMGPVPSPPGTVVRK